jgi:hypothetical protein
METTTAPTTEYILREGVLNDNTLYVPPFGYRFKGGFIAIIKEWSFQNAWSNKLNVVKFKSENSLKKYIEKHYKEFDTCEIELG